MASNLDGDRLLAVFEAMLAAHGPQDWWPAETPFEVMVGAVLTQNTSWTNVERGLNNLAALGALTAPAILALPEPELAARLRPVGYFNVKARRLRAFCAAYLAHGGLAGLSRLATAELRQRLLAIKGVGPETADDILLYAFDRPVFVVDAYSRRLLSRLGELDGNEGYETIRQGMETALGPDVALFNEYHALIVRHGKEVCRTRPRCGVCCLAALCPGRQG
ncbi:MAG: endonuclease [Chromatiaceae bacterium]|nr:endonuclease [Chromatiaceae bacterium]